MRLLLDQGMPRSAAEALRNAGVDAVHTAEIGLSRAEDETIIERGSVEGRAVVTLDADFHTLLALSGAVTPSVVRIHIEGLRGDEMAELLLRVLAQCRPDLEQGAVVSVTPDRIRVRRLPLVR